MEDPEPPATDTATPEANAAPDEQARRWWWKIVFWGMSTNCYILGFPRIPPRYSLVEIPANLVGYSRHLLQV